MRPWTGYICFFAIASALLSSCTSFANTTNPFDPKTPAKVKEQIETKPVWVTVYIHGIISIKPHLNIENFIRFIYDDIANTHYEKTVLLMRDDPFFHQNQPMQNMGMQEININHLQRGAGARLLAHATDKIEQITQPDAPTENHYYTFGWSGLMSYNARYLEAKNLYTDLVKIRDEFRAKGKEPHFRLEAYSHGGQVVMLLGKVRRDEHLDNSLHIDQTVFFGMPVHTFTAEYINDPVFARVYNIYSPGDRIQQLDIFTIGQMCSTRIFKKSHLNPAERKLIQIEIRVIRKAGENKKYSDRANRNIHYEGPCKSYLLRDVSPGHTELWFFGWTPLHYRKSFPLYPLPIVAITPYILNTIKHVEHELQPHQPIIMTLDPANDLTLLKTADDRFARMVPFISAKKFDPIRKEIGIYEPPAFTNDLYSYHIKLAYDEAHLFRTQHKIDVRRSRRKCPNGPNQCKKCMD